MKICCLVPSKLSNQNHSVLLISLVHLSSKSNYWRLWLICRQTLSSLFHQSYVTWVSKVPHYCPCQSNFEFFVFSLLCGRFRRVWALETRSIQFWESYEVSQSFLLTHLDRFTFMKLVRLMGVQLQIVTFQVYSWPI